MKARIQKIEAVREHIRARHSERAALEDQPRSREEVRQKVAALVAEWRSAALKKHAMHLQLIAGGEHPSVLDFGSEHISGPLLVLMLGAESVQQALLAGIDMVPEGSASDERASRCAAIDAELDDLETEEEALIVQAENAGEAIIRRADARPEIVLGKCDPAPSVRSPRYQGLGDVPAPRRRTSVLSTYLRSSRP